MNDRQQALLDAARCLPFADHVGDVRSSLALLWMSAGLGEIPADEASGVIDDAELERMGGRKCHEVPRDRDVLLFELLDAMLQRWPELGHSTNDACDLAAALGVELWSKDERMRFRPAPEGMDPSPESILVGDTTGWEKVRS